MADVTVPNKKEPVLSLVLSFLLPGLGQLYNTQFRKGLILMAAYVVSIILIYATLWLVIGFCFLIIPVVLWAYGMYDAFVEAKRVNRGKPSSDWLS